MVNGVVADQSLFDLADGDGEIRCDTVRLGVSAVAVQSGGKVQGDDAGVLLAELVHFPCQHLNFLGQGSPGSDAQNAVDQDDWPGRLAMESGRILEVCDLRGEGVPVLAEQWTPGFPGEGAAGTDLPACC